jgi:hypothetical protein
MGAHASKVSLPQIAVIAKNLKPSRIVFALQPSVCVGGPSEPVVAPVLGAVVVYVVDAKKPNVIEPAARTLPTICRKNLLAFLLAEAEHDGLHLAWVFLAPSEVVLAEPFPDGIVMSQVIGVLALASAPCLFLWVQLLSHAGRLS